ncbi:hypothetical protein MB02_11830 [Croceicoccus estronivorus]|uniref:FAD-dependent oxidoreductase n=1 Tax=Croceicoccus estronivorus TaxID=1172626 RepID=UPI00082EC57F|nr:FAD-dependent oxidoreductase [Croceicoccus estronivorus]OCC23318.1 hypothetical protein MB02_11830 [Croceicoccus estronivorus]
MERAPEHEADVVVIGAGAAGLAAAIAAHDSGAKVALLEASDCFGGTAAWSGGAAWVPLNGFARDAGIDDDRDSVLGYMRHCAEGRGDETLFAAYLDAGPEALDYLSKATPIDFTVGTMPDYHGGVPGGMLDLGKSRSVAPDVFDLNRLGEARPLARRSPHGTMPFSFLETEEMKATIHPERIDPSEYSARLEKGLVGWGEALAAGLFAGVVERGIALHPQTRARRLLANGRVHGVEAETDHGRLSFLARRGVVLATGGFEWNAADMEENFPVGIEPATVPTNRGDGLAMARQVDAALGNMQGLWGWPAYCIPGEVQPDGHPLVRTSLIERLMPHLICVNGQGQRFVDETQSYHIILKHMTRRDAAGDYPNLPAFHVFDGQFREKYPFGPVMPGQKDPSWLTGHPDLASLAEAKGISAADLEQTVAEYNAAVMRGHDDAFGRGGGGYAAFFGDRDNPGHPNLGTIEKPPFYAVEMIPATIGTCGGPLFDPAARVLGRDGHPIAGLYAAGNVTAAFSGPSYFGPGCTLGAALIFGVTAGRSAARDEVSDV